MTCSNTIKFFAVYLILIISIAISQTVKNGGFENTSLGEITNESIEGWSFPVGSSVSDPPYFAIVDDTVHKGNHALMVVVKSIGTNDWDIQAVAESIKVDPAKTYIYSVWAKSKKGNAKVNFTVGNYIYHEYGRIGGVTLSTEWENFTFEFQLDDGSTTIRAPIHFNFSENIRDTIWIDDFKIIDVEKEFASRVPVIIEAEDGELGEDFTTGTDGDITYITVTTDYAADVAKSAPDTLNRNKRTVKYNVLFPYAGTYSLYAKVKVGPNGYNDDSFWYSNGFGDKDASNPDDWIAVNGLANAGFTNAEDVVFERGAAGNNVWKWVNLSNNKMEGEVPINFTVQEDSTTVIFMIGGREDGLYFDKFAFGRSDLYFTVEMLDSAWAGSPEWPKEPVETWPGPPLATGHIKFLGNVWSSPQKKDFEKYWNQVTPENAGKWGSVEGTRDVMNWTILDEAYNFAKEHEFPFMFHVLIWGAQQPSWMNDNTLTDDEKYEEITEWFHAVADRYPDIDFLQVVNEPLHQPPQYKSALGGNGDTGWDWVINAFQLARDIFPDTVKLMINDFGIIGSTSSTQQYLNIINLLKERGLIDAIGVQGHAFTTYYASTSTIKSCLDLLASTGLPVYVTELDIDGVDDQVQLEEYQRVFPTLYQHPGVMGITLWGWRRGLWRDEQGAYLINSDGSERPAMKWLIAYMDTVQDYVSIEEDLVQGNPLEFKLYNNYPNPFNPTTTISFSVPINTHVKLTVFNILGQYVKTIYQGNVTPGTYSILFDGSQLESGIYFYRIDTDGFSQTKKFILLK